MFRRYFLLLVALMPGLACAAETTRALPAVEVISNTPLPGLTLSRDLIPAPVQTANDRDLIRGNPLNLADFLNQNLSGVHINETQNNPFQPDVNYRGYSASPLLGTPQGLSVYMDGVRLNQPFGDVVSWDLISKSAIASIALMPGSNPLFGLNTLGGALAIQTKELSAASDGAVTKLRLVENMVKKQAEGVGEAATRVEIRLAVAGDVEEVGGLVVDHRMDEVLSPSAGARAHRGGVTAGIAEPGHLLAGPLVDGHNGGLLGLSVRPDSGRTFVRCSRHSISTWELASPHGSLRSGLFGRS